MAAIRVDGVTGVKSFRTRAGVAARDGSLVGLAARGYSTVEKQMTVLPRASAGATFGAAEQETYRVFKARRQGSANYVTISPDSEFGHYLQDHYSAAPVEREALTDECDILVVGGGISALLLWHKLAKAGWRDVRFCEKGGDVGGTWYWNRYPGIACDVEAYSYLPLLEEMGYIPSMKFASGFEILEYCQGMAEKFDFYSRALFHTTVTGQHWDSAGRRWTVTTDRGDAMRARFVVLANGLLTQPQLARIDGMETFKGDSFHTSRWNYNVDLRGKRVGIIGTGATAVQAIPELAKVVKELYVFQRTPSSIDVRDQRETTEEERKEWSQLVGAGKAPFHERRARFAKISAGRSAMQANDDYLAGRVNEFRDPTQGSSPKSGPQTHLSSDERIKRQLDTNFRIMEQLRSRVDAIVKDPATAAALKPYYPYGCKRPTFHDEYLPAFNLPHVHLVDTAPRGVTGISAQGPVHDGKQYHLDVLVFATGFKWMATSTFNTVIGRGSRSLTEKWRDEGTKTFLGLHVRGFPNLFVMTGPQGGGGAGFNFTEAIVAHADYVVQMLAAMESRGATVVDVREEFEESWARHCAEADVATAPFRDCISYYNGHGEGRPGELAYYGGHHWWTVRDQAMTDLEPFIFDDLLRAKF